MKKCYLILLGLLFIATSTLSEVMASSQQRTQRSSAGNRGKAVARKKQGQQQKGARGKTATRGGQQQKGARGKPNARGKTATRGGQQQRGAQRKPNARGKTATRGGQQQRGAHGKTAANGRNGRQATGGACNSKDISIVVKGSRLLAQGQGNPALKAAYKRMLACSSKIKGKNPASLPNSLQSFAKGLKAACAKRSTNAAMKKVFAKACVGNPAASATRSRNQSHRQQMGEDDDVDSVDQDSDDSLSNNMDNDDSTMNDDSDLDDGLGDDGITSGNGDDFGMNSNTGNGDNFGMNNDNFGMNDDFANMGGQMGYAPQPGSYPAPMMYPPQPESYPEPMMYPPQPVYPPQAGGYMPPMMYPPPPMIYPQPGGYPPPVYDGGYGTPGNLGF